ncbi:MAG: hypothetical protein IPH57_00120 [Saprospiraceae bacterium]|nr:hypothetical protein [Saprospiraceae bacterium]
MQEMVRTAGLKNLMILIILPMSSEEPDSAVWYAKQDLLLSGIVNVSGMNFQKARLLHHFR